MIKLTGKEDDVNSYILYGLVWKDVCEVREENIAVVEPLYNRELSETLN